MLHSRLLWSWYTMCLWNMHLPPWVITLQHVNNSRCPRVNMCCFVSALRPSKWNWCWRPFNFHEKKENFSEFWSIRTEWNRWNKSSRRKRRFCPTSDERNDGMWDFPSQEGIQRSGQKELLQEFPEKKLLLVARQFERLAQQSQHEAVLANPETNILSQVSWLFPRQNQVMCWIMCSRRKFHSSRSTINLSKHPDPEPLHTASLSHLSPGNRLELVVQSISQPSSFRTAWWKQLNLKYLSKVTLQDVFLWVALMLGTHRLLLHSWYFSCSFSALKETSNNEGRVLLSNNERRVLLSMTEA